MYFGKKPYGLETYIEHHGDGSNLYRTETFAQPRALEHGDILSNGWQVEGETFDAFNGGVGVNFHNGMSRRIPARLPLQLLGDLPGTLPMDLRVGQILQTGCVVLEPSYLSESDPRSFPKQVEAAITLTGGAYGADIGVPVDLEIATIDEVYPPNADTILGAFAIEKVIKMDVSVRENLLSRVGN